MMSKVGIGLGIAALVAAAGAIVYCVKNDMFRRPLSW